MEIKSAVTTTGAVDFRIFTLILSGMPDRKLEGVKITYELKRNENPFYVQLSLNRTFEIQVLAYVEKDNYGNFILTDEKRRSI